MVTTSIELAGRRRMASRVPARLCAALIFVLLPLGARALDTNLVLDLGGAVSLELILIPKGAYEQGSPAAERSRKSDEAQRRVVLSDDFYLGKFPVTLPQFDRFVSETGYRTEAERGQSGGFGWNGHSLEQNKRFNWRDPGFAQQEGYPVTTVTFDDAQAFCEWLSSKSGRQIALPTEAQWEYACRAGSTTAWHNSDDEKKAWEIAWFKPISENATHPVNSRKPNAWGLYMSGNVYEWCRDWYAEYKPGDAVDPLQTNSSLSDKPRRVLRGGSWAAVVAHTRSAARYRASPGSRNADIGFRVMTIARPPALNKSGILLEEPETPTTPPSKRPEGGNQKNP